MATAHLRAPQVDPHDFTDWRAIERDRQRGRDFFDGLDHAEKVAVGDGWAAIDWVCDYGLPAKPSAAWRRGFREALQSFEGG